VKRFLPAIAAAGLLTIVGAVPAGANGGTPNPDSGFKVVVDGLNNPRQILTAGRAVLVAEAGQSQDPAATCGPDGSCVGLSGSVTGYIGGFHTRIQTGLVSISSPPEGGGEGPNEVVGVDALALDNWHLYGIATGTCEDLAGVPAPIASQLGKVLRLRGDDRVTPVADVAGYECAHDPDGQGVDTDPYGIAARHGTIYVADAAGNDVLKVRGGTTSLATVLSKTGQPVPTSLAFGPDGALYIGTLDFEAGPGGANVYRLAPGATTATVYASGLSAITGIAFGRDGELYVSEFTTGFDQNGPSPDGDVVIVPSGGGTKTDSWHTLGTGKLHFPGGVGVTSDGVYVSNWSIADATDGAFGPGNHGQLVRLSP
jgi:SMP-30/Gluconolactonase/LRE-like region